MSAQAVGAYDSKWHALRRKRLAIAKANMEPCALCGRAINYTLPGNARMGPTIDHTLPLAHGGEMLPSLEELRPAHRVCQSKQGAKIANQGMKRTRTGQFAKKAGLGSSGAATVTPPAISLVVSPGVRQTPVTLSRNPRYPGERDGLPRYFSEPHPDAVSTRGDEFVAYAEARRGGPLRWFQWVSAQRRYEVRADGSWCWLMAFESTPRQQGKSVTLAEDAAWYASTTSGPELILHTAYRVKNSLKVQADLWPWAEKQSLDVRRLLGDSHILWPNGTDWATIAMESAYGERPHRLLADEAWALEPVKFWNGPFPALGDRDNPQILFWSTANPGERGLVADLRSDPKVLRMEWGAISGEDFLDPAVWRSSSAYWGPGRETLMEVASKRPGFNEEWLNVWPEPQEQGAGPFPRWDAAAVCIGDPPSDAVVALDQTPDASAVAVAAYARGCLWYRQFTTLRDAADLVHRWGSEELIVGFSLRAVAASLSLPVVASYGVKEAAAGLPLLVRAVTLGEVSHEHQAGLDAQFAGAVLKVSDGGVTSLSVRTSRGLVIGPKLASWLLLYTRDRAGERAAIF